MSSKRKTHFAGTPIAQPFFQDPGLFDRDWGRSYRILYPWRAIFADGTQLQQFNEKGKETLFKEVLKLAAEGRRLIKFEVGPVALNLIDGSFTIYFHSSKSTVKLYGSSLAEAFEEWGIDERLRKQLIYFRRVKRQFEWSFRDKQGEEWSNPPYVVYALGWHCRIPKEIMSKEEQEKYPEGRNVKHVLFIHPDFKDRDNPDPEMLVFL